MLITLAIGSRMWSCALNHSTLTYLGRISYSLYLTHNIVTLVLVDELYTAISDTALVLLIIAASLLTADLYCRLIEYPSMRLGRWLTQRSGSRRRYRPDERLRSSVSPSP